MYNSDSCASKACKSVFATNKPEDERNLEFLLGQSERSRRGTRLLTLSTEIKYQHTNVNEFIVVIT